ncbi:MAG: glycosyltransferase family 4 protein [Chloroflexi bacterium]|nr:glycosyltransferase family 4 protein [Chloroflexota bacterium]
MPYRVLMIAPTSFFLDYGCHVRILEEARILQQRGHRVKIVTYPIGNNVPDLDIERTLPIPFRPRQQVGPSRSKVLIDALLALKTLQVALRFKPNVIHGHLHEGALIGGVLSRLMRVPLVFDLQGSATSELADHRFVSPNSPILSIIRALEWHIDRLPDAILTSSYNAAQMLASDFAVAPSKTTVLLDCVHSDQFEPVSDGLRAEQMRDLQARLNIPPERHIVVYIGLLDEYRGIGVLLDAAAQLVRRGVDAHFVIIGFPNVVRYQARAQELGISERVSFPGRVPYEQAPLWLSLGDVAVEPKMSATEAAGKVLNYMAMALPIVAFDIPVMRDYLGELGVYAPLGDATAFANQIQQLLADRERARAIGQALRVRAQECYSWEHAGQEIERVYERVLAR